MPSAWTLYDPGIVWSRERLTLTIAAGRPGEIAKDRKAWYAVVRGITKS